MELVKYGFQGREMDVETGFLNFRNRIYNPVQGRFLQRDPIGFAGGMGLHEFTGGSPHNRSDSLGLDWATDTLCYAQELDNRRQAFEQLPQMIAGGSVNLTLDVMTFLNSMGSFLPYFLMNNWQAIMQAMPPLAQNSVGDQQTGGRSWWNRFADYFAGFGDIMTLGVTWYIRQRLGWNDVVDTQSTAYTAGKWTAYLYAITEFALGLPLLSKRAAHAWMPGQPLPFAIRPLFKHIPMGRTSILSTVLFQRWTWFLPRWLPIWTPIWGNLSLTSRQIGLIVSRWSAIHGWGSLAWNIFS
jgi:RHS repeat-associated protein